jgi:glc operon protein GlcG
MNKIIKSTALALVLSAMAAATARAQVNKKEALTLDGARKVIASAMAEAKRVSAPGGVIAVVDDGGNLIALERMDNTFTAGANISIGKAKTAVMFKRPTKFFEDVIKNGRTAMVALPDFTPLQGGVPIEYNGQIIGGVGVSGAASAQQDEEIAIAGANTFRSQKAHATTSTPSPVIHFESKNVREAFAKGAVLIDGSDGRNYMVHASRRDKPGMAEVHTLDTDVIYVLEGSATFVTGGTVDEPKAVAPNEIRGVGINGGQTRRLSKGDVITVANGTPHWFKEVEGTLLYYVVKVR